MVVPQAPPVDAQPEEREAAVRREGVPEGPERLVEGETRLVGDVTRHGEAAGLPGARLLERREHLVRPPRGEDPRRLPEEVGVPLPDVGPLRFEEDRADLPGGAGKKGRGGAAGRHSPTILTRTLLRRRPSNSP